jgi:oligosaccharide reducing-end xylanase
MVQWIIVGVGALSMLNGSGGSATFATGQYRNLFAEMGGTPERVTAKIDAAFQQLFHGDPNTQTLY